MQKTLRHRTAAAIFAAAMMIAVGCSSPEAATGETPTTSTAMHPGPPENYQPPDQVRNATTVWSAEPGIDLFDERGRLIRATREARTIAIYAGAASSYPGYATTLNSTDAFSFVEPLPKSLVGTLHFHIFSVVDTDDGFVASVCTQLSQYAEWGSNHRYQRWNHPASEVSIEFDHDPNRVEYPVQVHSPGTENTKQDSDPTPPTTTPGAPQWQAPTEDLFTDSDWTMTFGGGPRESQDRCTEWGRQYVTPEHPDEYSYYTDTPPTALPAYQGW